MLANKFLVLGILLYIIAGISVIIQMNYNILILLVAIIFLAVGFFKHKKTAWLKLVRKRAQKRQKI
ncbi:MAG: hypothetical protein V1831_02335 [Candidatus Woesearchaeota archaeon]